MKNRRLTIFCVALVALAGTPRAWQEASNLLAAVQHKAQVKFWSLVLQPKNRESAAVEFVAQAGPFESQAGGLDADCPLEAETPASNQARSAAKAVRKVNAASSSRPQQKEQPPQPVAPLSHAGLIAKALKAPRGDSNAESLRRSRNFTFESRLTEVIESHPTLLAQDKPTAPKAPVAARGETFKLMVLPAVSPNVASVLIEKENALRLKSLRKAIDEPKTIRQKNRLPAVRGAATYFPTL